MPYYLVSTHGQRVTRFHDFREAKIHQCLAMARGTEYSIDVVHCEGGCSFPQCYVPCWNCDNRIRSIEEQLDEMVLTTKEDTINAHSCHITDRA